MANERSVLRQLAHKYWEIAHSDHNAEVIRLHRAVNDLSPIRPVVLLSEIPWHQMNINDELTLVCEDPILRKAEEYLRRVLFQYKYFPGDMVVRPFLPIHKRFTDDGIGVTVDESTLAADKGNHIISHEYHDQLATEEDVEKLHNRTIVYDHAGSMAELERVADVIGDILPVKLHGLEHLYISTWDDIARYRGVTNLLIDLAERPAFTHKIVRKLTDITLDTIRQYEELGLLEAEPYELHCTCAATADLPPLADGEHVTRKNIWGRGMAQIFSTVSKEMREEFDINYMKETIGQCGLSYYGCCEPLDKMVDVVEKLPNLRKISITPWADVDVAAEAIGKKYVLANKPNPAAVALSQLDVPALEAELTKTLDACRRNGCSCDIVLKDISTCHNRPENIFEWEQTAMRLVQSY